jgi:hypothetical protein
MFDDYVHIPVWAWNWTFVQNRKERRSSIILGTFSRIRDVFAPWPTEFARLSSSPSSRIMWLALRPIGWQVTLVEIKSIRKGLWMVVVGLRAPSSFVSFGVTYYLKTMGIVWSCQWIFYGVLGLTSSISTGLYLLRNARLCLIIHLNIENILFCKVYNYVTNYKCVGKPTLFSPNQTTRMAHVN